MNVGEIPLKTFLLTWAKGHREKHSTESTTAEIMNPEIADGQQRAIKRETEKGIELLLFLDFRDA